MKHKCMGKLNVANYIDVRFLAVTLEQENALPRSMCLILCLNCYSPEYFNLNSCRKCNKLKPRGLILQPFVRTFLVLFCKIFYI